MRYNSERRKKQRKIMSKNVYVKILFKLVASRLRVCFAFCFTFEQQQKNTTRELTKVSDVAVEHRRMTHSVWVAPIFFLSNKRQRPRHVYNNDRSSRLQTTHDLFHFSKTSLNCVFSYLELYVADHSKARSQHHQPYVYLHSHVHTVYNIQHVGLH